MRKLNEKEIIKIFQNKLGNKNFIPEDVEVFKIGKTSFVTKVDTLVESTDIPPSAKLNDVARKSVVACVSDFAAKGVKPRFGIFSITIPCKYSKNKIKQLASGLADASDEFGFKILGGDTNEGKELVIQFFLFGITKKIIPRKGAKVKDKIITTGTFGYTSAGLKILLNKKKATKKFVNKSKKAVFQPQPKLDFALKNSRYFSSSMDSSDGLSATLHEMAKQSGKKFVLTNLPANSDLFDFAHFNRLDPLDLIFQGGEEYEIVATVSPHKLENIKADKTCKLFEIGYVTKGSGVFYKKDKNYIKIQNRGWIHFQS